MGFDILHSQKIKTWVRQFPSKNSGIGKLAKRLLPEVDSSGLAFKDLFLDPNRKTVRSNN